MSWQEELRKLDEELAAGRISADDYRVRRDQVLSSAVSLSPEAPPPVQPPSQGESTQFIQTGPPLPVQPSYGAPGQGADRTQIVGGQSGQSDADKTQIVPGAGPDPSMWNQPMVGGGGWQTARPPAGPSGADADRTQVVPGVPPQAYVGGQPPRPAPGTEQGPFSPPGGFPPPMGWQQPAEDANSPWGGSVFPPLTPTGSPDWIRQGPEVFDDAPSGRKKALLIVLAVLLVAGAGAAIYFLAIKKDSNNNANNPPANPPATTTQQTQKPTSTTKPRPSDPNVALLEDMPKPPASLQQQGKVLDVTGLVAAKLMDAPEVQLLSTAGVTKVIWRSAVRKSPEDGPTPDTLSAMIIPTDSSATAQKLVTDLRAYQEAHGYLYIAEPLPNMPPTVTFEKAFPAGQSIYRGLWVSGNNVIRMTTVQAPFTKEDSLSGSYRNHTEIMLRTFPPN